MLKRLEETKAVSTSAMNQLSEKEKIIQEQAKLLEDKEKDVMAEVSASKFQILEVRKELAEKEKIVNEFWHRREHAQADLDYMKKMYESLERELKSTKSLLSESEQLRNRDNVEESWPKKKLYRIKNKGHK